MRRAVSGFVVALMLMVSASPVLACMLPEPMSQAEQDCCKHMAGDCDEMAGEMSDMPASEMDHSCCAKTTSAVVQAAALSGRASQEIQTSTFIAAAAQITAASPEAGFAVRWHLRINSPPAPSAPVSISILRI